MGGGHHANPEAYPKDEQDFEAVKAAKIPIANRDRCVHLLLPLNKCRRVTGFNPNTCGHERHTYEECLYNTYLQRIEALKQKKRLMSG
mmetsp:Transcript_7874/g.12141  ORF Transcript_7874/g.12141 Transcript_7874/m.12141 type:complete len:88 (+) Transcript_7874:163-426(+)